MSVGISRTQKIAMPRIRVPSRPLMIPGSVWRTSAAAITARPTAQRLRSKRRG